jgi:hypothetical protein
MSAEFRPRLTVADGERIIAALEESLHACDDRDESEAISGLLARLAPLARTAAARDAQRSRRVNYRVHLYDTRDGRWRDSADFAQRPSQEEAAGAFHQLQGPGWFELRLCRMSGRDEHLASWTWQDGSLGRKEA